MRTYIGLVTALVLVAACSDAPTAAGREGGFRPEAFLGNPPPPAISGTVSGNFSVDEVVGSVRSQTPTVSIRRAGVPGATRASADVAPSTISFHLSFRGTEFNGMPDGSEAWLNFPRQPIPPFINNRFGPPNGPPAPLGPKPRIHFANGFSVGQAYVYVQDDVNGGFWFIDLTQFTHSGPFFVQGHCQGCFELVPQDIHAVFYKQVGVNDRGRPIFQAFVSNPGDLGFVPHNR